MKKIYFLLMAIAVTMCYSCSDILDTYPKDKISSSTFWKSKEDVNLALAGCYGKLKSSNFLAENRPFLDGLVDNGYCQYPWNGNAKSVQLGFLNPNTGGVLTDIYAGMYRGVTACYIFLENFENVKEQLGYSVEEQNKIIAEVRFLKGYFLFELVQRFGGVVIYDKVPTIEESMVAKKSLAESLDYILADLDYAIQNLPDEVFTGHAVKNSALGLKARVALFKEDWNTVKDVTSQIVNSAAQGKTSFSATHDPIFIKRLGQQNCPEIMFSVQFLNPDAKQQYYGIEIEAFYWSAIAPEASFIAAHEANDLRLKEWYYESVNGRYLRPTDNTYFAPVGASLTGYGLVKFFDKTNPDKYLKSEYDCMTEDDVVLLRYTEIMLMYAEAMVELGNGSTSDAQAIDFVNQIRNRAGLDAIEGNLTRDVLRNERRLELAFEGFRMFDLYRWRTAEQVMNGFKSVGGVCKFEPNQYLWPFPQSEVDVNPQLEQNPGY